MFFNLELRIADFGLRIADCGLICCKVRACSHSAFHDKKPARLLPVFNSAIRNPQSAIEKQLLLAEKEGSQR